MELIIDDIINNIEIGYDFGFNIDIEDDEDDFLYCVYDALINAGIKDFHLNHGVSKMVIIPKDSKYVIKTPLFGSWSYEEFYNKEEECYELDYDNPFFEDYINAGSNLRETADIQDINVSNYCEVDVEVYELAKEYGIEEMFAKTFFYRNGYGGRPMYLSEKCKRSYGLEPTKSSSNTVKENKWKKGWSKLSPRISALFIDHYGLDKYIKLINFLEKYQIYDLHDDNIMISEWTGKIVLSDYSNFNS